MPDWILPTQQGRTVGVLLFEQFSNHCLANAIEPLRAANGLLGDAVYRWEVLTLDGAPVTSSSGFDVAPSGRLAEATGDALVLLPSYGARRLATPACSRALRAAAQRFTTLVGLDMGSWLLAEAGLLDGHAATIHFDEFEAFAERFPEVEARRSRWVRDRDVWTAGGAMTSYELVVDYLSRSHGTALSLEIASLFMHSDADAPVIDVPSQRDRIVARALAEMEANIEEPLPIGTLARFVGCTQRQLEVRFERALGATPRAVYRRLRLNVARRLLVEARLGVAEIALRSGYSDASAFARAFRREHGRAPRDYRR
ncbi:AraC family transcriptional regulator with amidase-like domain [Aliiruegeria haliotis]|uniref:AraC family transcriptional regulator with amidase-like domain n=1 Tax=Aliiruegeria haliotis TaxID=1280846 RepID=A0A2T0RRR9_9RHOB|nr:GlxA family transcriptional regulator [Aliiruegeria haliotis]PRY23851.1 AraC family transcriptional regulator with amidase-like domain [Aliiruegeria haliotis]